MKILDFPVKNRRAICKDGFSLSIQADRLAYSLPRVNDADNYTSVEVGFPSEHEPLLAPYQEGEGDMKKSVFGYVPASVIGLILIKHGGMVEGELPAGIPAYTLPETH